MIIDARIRWQIRLQSGLFILLFLFALGLLAWLSKLYSVSIDLSANERNSLSQESIRLVESLQDPLEITLFISPLNENRDLLERLFRRYQDRQPRIRFRSLNPDLTPDLLRQYDIRLDGETLIEYQGRSEKVSQVTESNITNAIQRLMRQGERWLVFLQGHGERNPYREANDDYSLFATQLAGKGFTVENLTLAQTNSIPENTDVLIIASPLVPLLVGESDLLQDYLERGGNLLWFADPDQTTDGLERLANKLAIDFLPGVIVDPNSQLFGLNRVDFALVAEYPRHPITQQIRSLSLFPQAQAIEYAGDDETWEKRAILRSGDNSWSETGSIAGEVFNGDNPDETNGPLDIGITLSRSLQQDDGSQLEQRVAVIGDADFLSNRYLGNGSNLELGLNMINWLSRDDNLISISPRPAPDTRLVLSQTQQIVISLSFLLVIPLLLTGTGLRIWLRRRKL
ncbi:MAG: GldG family protein [Gammaproteobacteria bacterium]